MNKNILISLLLIFVVLPILTLIGLYTYYHNSVNKKINLEENIEFAIEKGSSVDAIGKLLKENGLISDPLMLKAYLYFNPDKTLQAGYYRFAEGSLTLPDVVEKLQSGSFEKKLTFIEGWRVEEYIDYLKTEMGDDFSKKFADSEYLKEGYMFPDTYIIAADYDPNNLASWMRNNFVNKSKANDWEQRAFNKGFTLDEVIIIASILEREMHIEKDRPIVAGILIKRLNNDWPLQADATIQYAKGSKSDWWPIVRRDDLKGISSPYNTYENKGLPPAPIANPSLSAIEAVLDYEESPYWFYITGSDGTTRYADTLEKHNQNVANYLK